MLDAAAPLATVVEGVNKRSKEHVDQVKALIQLRPTGTRQTIFSEWPPKLPNRGGGLTGEEGGAEALTHTEA